MPSVSTLTSAVAVGFGGLRDAIQERIRYLGSLTPAASLNPLAGPLDRAALGPACNSSVLRCLPWVNPLQNCDSPTLVATFMASLSCWPLGSRRVSDLNAISQP
jgi:hypothetical protein